jgi:RNA binding activity-knot of a chromodomain
MMYQIIPIFAQAAPTTSLGLQVLSIVLAVPMIITIVGIWAGAWTKVNKLRLENALKQQMIDRGMSAEDIVTVLTRSKPSEAGTELPCASEVVVESDGEWHTGLILKREGERYYVHYVGTDMSDNEWVTTDRIRFPASSDGRCGAPWDWSFPAGAFGAGDWCGKGGRSKPAPVDQEM